MPVARDHMLYALEMCAGPLALVFSLWLAAWWFEGGVAGRYVILSFIVFSLTFPASAHLTRPVSSVIRRVVVGWIALAGILTLAGYASGYLEYFEHDVLMTWLWLAPISELSAHVALRWSAPAILELQGTARRAVVAGMNTQGVELARRLSLDPYSRVDVVGFFDDRDIDRIDPQGQRHLLGRISMLSTFAKAEKIELIYIALPMASQPRIRALLEDLHDTTASIYFVPDIFVTDLIQGRMDLVSGLPVVAVCETPFTGLSGVTKRVSDVVLTLLILTLIAVPMLVIALAVRLTSRGPVIFKQRRYGVDGREIVVYKFRTMTVLEDGAEIEQATPGDPRITSVGRVLRKLSLDELPQFFNVLQGRMSIVGPRPHAVAHNELYRKLIKGYMLRHKVKPGITGWAQVNGYRGETRDLDAMKGRIEYDLDYLRNWSLRLDLYIIAKTVWVVLAGTNAH
jgi:putative colanic acid biosysnthesis UDP-glucose lipid carrier transferase